MKYVPGQHINYKKYSAEIVFFYPSYKKGMDAYTIKFSKGGTEYHRLCMEDELLEEKQIKLDQFKNT
jgi:hypothetical protein